MSPSPVVALIGTLDTKAAEIAYARDKLREMGVTPYVIDSGILGKVSLVANVTRSEVAQYAGHTLDQVQNAGSRGAAVEIMEVGLARLVRERYDSGDLHGVLCFGGAEGGLMGAAAAQALPLGVPKLILSPAASGRREFGPFMGQSDTTVMHSVIDILGLNSVARSVFDNAVAAMVGMVKWAGRPPSSERSSVGITMLGQTTPGVMVLAQELEKSGYEPIIFHANGIGGPAMDKLAADGGLVGVVEYTISEAANTAHDGIHATDDSRMRAAAEAGLPFIIVPGAADFFNQGPEGTVPAEFLARKHYKHNPVATLVRVTSEEMPALAELIVSRIEGARGPVKVIFPLGGFSLVGVGDGPLADHLADARLADELEKRLPESIPIIRSEYHVNEPEFARLVSSHFLEMMERKRSEK